MRTNSICAILLGVVAGVFLLNPAASGPLYPEGYKPPEEKSEDKKIEEEDGVDLSKLTPYNRVGVLPFVEMGKQNTSEERFFSILIGRLKNNFPDTEFVRIEISLDEDTPLMGETSRQLGEEYEIDAILTGYFLVSVRGGLYPTRTNNLPVGKMDIECRVIETYSGFSRGYASVAWKKDKIYPKTVATQKSLEGKLMRDGAEDLIEALTKRGLLWFEPEIIIEAPVETVEAEEKEE